MLGGVLGIIPLLGFINLFLAIYTLYILYAGFSSLPSVPDEKKLGLYLVSIVSLVVTFAIINVIVFSVLPKQYSYDNVGESIEKGLTKAVENVDQEKVKQFMEKMQRMSEAAQQGTAQGQ